MNALISNTRNPITLWRHSIMPLFLCLSLVVSNIANAQVDLSPKGRIDIQNDQAEDWVNSTKDLIFKNSGPLRDVVVGNAYISGTQTCEVDISTSYFQAASQAIVEAEIDHTNCAASNGKYTVGLKIQDAAGEIHSKKYKEVWSRADAQAINVKHSYQIGDNMDLLRARIKLPSRDYCTCIGDEE
ncbi:MAG: hypothetical protein ACI9WC_000281 [Arenicella sp.]|jgi:hypothetical protein